MATAVVDRVCRTAAPDQIDAELEALWSDLGRQGPVTRAVMANLVVFCETPAGDRVDLTAPIADLPLDQVSQRHPSRVILLHHSRGGSDASGPSAAAVAVLLFGGARVRFGVEQIALRSACPDAALPSLVRRLTFGDRPTSVWWTEDLSTSPLLEAVVGAGRQLLYDSRRWRDVRRGFRAIAALLHAGRPLDLADLNWRRLTPMRQALAQALAAGASPAERRAARAHIRQRPGDSALAWLLAGWLAAELRPAQPDRAFDIEETRHGDDVLAVEFGGLQIAAEMNGHRVLARDPSSKAPLSVCVPHETAADAIAAELRELRRDTALHEALLALSQA